MQIRAASTLALALLGMSRRAAAEGNPLAKVFDLLDGLSTKIKQEGEEEAKAYKEYAAWCTDKVRTTGFEIEEATTLKSKLEARIEQLSADILVGDSKVEGLAAAVASNSAQLKEATQIRESEVASFLSAEKELRAVIDSLSRAHGVLQREMQKKGGSLAQVERSSMKHALELLGVVVEAASINTEDRSRLLAFVQSQDSSVADNYLAGAPAAAAYQSHSDSILDLIEDLKDKAEEQLSSLRKTETNQAHSYAKVKQALETQTDVDSKNLAQTKSDKSSAEEGKANAVGDLEITAKDLMASQERLESTKSDCARTAADHEDTVAAREEELKVISEAKEILGSSTAGAAEEAYSFLQVSASASATASTQVLERAKSEVFALVKKLAQKHHSSALAQLASRISAVERFGAGGGEDPFAKIKNLIQDLISRLQEEAADESTEKAYCDAETSKTLAKKGELSDRASKLGAKLDQSESRSAALKAQVVELQAQLAALAKDQAELDKIRLDGHAAYVAAKADLEQGLTGVRKALGVLRDYYGGAAFLQSSVRQSSDEEQPAAPEKHSKSGGAGSSLIGILEVVESDFSKSLVKEETEESDAQASYEKITQENKVATAGKTQDVTYKSQEASELEKTIVEVSQDRDSTQAELDAVLEYWAKLQERCVAKPESHEERASRRAAEIKGLKEALDVLQSEAALVQRGSRRRTPALRGLLAAR